MTAIYKLLERLSARKEIELHVFTMIEKWADPYWRSWMRREEREKGIHFHYIDLGILKEMIRLHFYASKIIYFLEIMRLHSKFRFDIIHEYSSAPLLVRRTSLLRWICNVRAFHSLWTYGSGFLGSFGFLGGTIDGIICSTRHMKTLLKRMHPKHKIMHIPIGIDIGRFNCCFDNQSLREGLGLSSRDRIILYIGLIEERKGILTLLKAASLILKKYPEALFVIATYPLEGNFYSYAKQHSKLSEYFGTKEERVRLLVGMQNIPLLMSLADIFVLPLNTMNGTLGYPHVLLEAMASGKAIVASDTPGIVELITNRKNGILFKRADAEGLVSAIELLLSDEELRKRLENNTKLSAKQYDWELIVDKLEQVYFEE